MPLLGTRGAASARGFGFAGAKPFGLGSPLGGGFFAGYISYSENNVPTHYMIVAPLSTGYTGPLTWSNSLTDEVGTYSWSTGYENSQATNNSSFPAAYFCRGLTIGGYTDWYLPAAWELYAIGRNLKAYTNAVSTTGYSPFGNPIAVPSWSGNLSASQTTATDFKAGGAQAFPPLRFWSSSQAGNPPNSGVYPNEGMTIIMVDVGPLISSQQKNSGLTNPRVYARAIRKIPV